MTRATGSSRFIVERMWRPAARRSRAWPVLSMVLLLAAGCMFGTAPPAGADSAGTRPDSSQRPGPAHRRATPAPDQVSGYAWIRPQDGVLVLTGPSTDFGYRIVQLDVEEGDMVEAGQPLAELDVERERAANLAVAKARVREAEVGADFASRELERKEKLFQMKTPGLSAEDLDATRRKAQLAAARLEVARRQEGYAEIMHEQATIRAPAAGMVLRILRHEGEGFTPGQGLIELGRVAQMEAVVEVFETEVRFVAPGQKATFASPALASPVQGKVLRTMPRVDRVKLYETNAGENVENRVVRVVIDLGDEPAVARLSGLQGIVTIDTSNGPRGAGDG